MFLPGVVARVLFKPKSDHITTHLQTIQWPLIITLRVKPEVLTMSKRPYMIYFLATSLT